MDAIKAATCQKFVQTAKRWEDTSTTEKIGIGKNTLERDVLLNEGDLLLALQTGIRHAYSRDQIQSPEDGTTEHLALNAALVYIVGTLESEVVQVVYGVATIRITYSADGTVTRGGQHELFIHGSQLKCSPF